MHVAIRILLALLALAIALLTFALVSLNEETVHVQLGVFDIPPMPLGALLAGTVGVGLIVGAVAVSPLLLRLAGQRRRLIRRLGELDSEVHELRTLPLRGDR